MRYKMRQGRDGEIEIIDLTPPIVPPQGMFAALLRPRWTAALRRFMRTMAWVWIAKGLANWAVVLGFWTRFGDFEMLPRALQGSMIFFAAADLVAAVGLWLAAPWGGAVWLMCAAIEATTPLMGSRGSFVNSIGVTLNVTLILTYFALSWRARREGQA